MKPFERLLLENKAWAEDKLAKEPEFFEEMAGEHKPEILWIGCTDSPVPSEIIVNAHPGEMVVHRNIANQVITTDFNSLSVLQYAVDVLEVRDVIVCGHYNCGGIRAGLQKQHPDRVILNKWLKHIKDIYRLHQSEIEEQATDDERARRLVELNVIEQVYNLAHSSLIQQSWKRKHQPTLHGWVYSLENGIIKELITLPPGSMISPVYQFGEHCES